MRRLLPRGWNPCTRRWQAPTPAGTHLGEFRSPTAMCCSGCRVGRCAHDGPMSDPERADLLDTLAKHRGFLRQTAKGITDEQAAARPTVSELCLGGLIKHVSRMEARWVGFIQHGTEAMAMTPESYQAHAASFRMESGETLASIVVAYEE